MAHPRSRGENLGDDALSATPVWLIPAHAGKTSSISIMPSLPRAHPRSRGENKYYRVRTVTLPGSSPLTRGKHYRAALSLRRLGLIPAHAGKTAPAAPPLKGNRAHPRSRGENKTISPIASRRAGSSPLTRGKHTRRRRRRVRVGLIPAHAGKTGLLRPGSSSPGAHPRSRGENAPDELEADFFRGSSPLTRGKLPVLGRELARAGLIPAHAGKTFVRQGKNHSPGAHPRSRGEN